MYMCVWRERGGEGERERECIIHIPWQRDFLGVWSSHTKPTDGAVLPLTLLDFVESKNRVSDS